MNEFREIVETDFSYYTVLEQIENKSKAEKIRHLQMVLFKFKEHSQQYWCNVLYAYKENGHLFGFDELTADNHYTTAYFFGSLGYDLSGRADDEIETIYEIRLKYGLSTFEDKCNSLLQYVESEQPEAVDLSNTSKPELDVMKYFETNEFDYNFFFDNIDKINDTQKRKLIQKETNNFDLFLLTQFYVEFIEYVASYKIHRIKFSDLDINFSQEIENDSLAEDNSLLSYVDYRMKRGELSRKRINIKFELTEPVDIKYFSELYTLFPTLESMILNYATAEQLTKLEPKPQQPEPEPLDLSDSKPLEKIALLYESGIIDFLHTKDGKPHTVNSIASLLSGITGVDPKTIQSAINPFINTHSTSKGTPAKSTLTKARDKIIDLGFNN